MLKRFTMAPEKKNMGMPDRLEISRETPSTDPVPPSSRSRLYAKFSITPLDSPIANTIEKNTFHRRDRDRDRDSGRGWRLAMFDVRLPKHREDPPKKKPTNEPLHTRTYNVGGGVEYYT